LLFKRRRPDTLPKPETTFTGSVHKYLPPEGTLHREKMNNPYRGGTADWWYSGFLADLWIEYKFVSRLPTHAEVRPDLSERQAKWLHRRYQEGRNVAVIIGCKTGGIILRALSWEQAIPIEEFRERLIDRPAIAHWIQMQTLGRMQDGVPTQGCSSRRRTE
jgi:hypothetical protein